MLCNIFASTNRYRFAKIISKHKTYHAKLEGWGPSYRICVCVVGYNTLNICSRVISIQIYLELTIAAVQINYNRINVEVKSECMQNFSCISALSEDLDVQIKI